MIEIIDNDGSTWGTLSGFTLDAQRKLIPLAGEDVSWTISPTRAKPTTAPGAFNVFPAGAVAGKAHPLIDRSRPSLFDRRREIPAERDRVNAERFRKHLNRKK